MGFTEEHSSWIEDHISRRTGERRGRLERGHSHGERMFVERVWWPMMGHFKDLHPEYEVADAAGRILLILYGSREKLSLHLK